MEVKEHPLMDREGTIWYTPKAPIRIYVCDPTDRGRILRDANRELLFDWCRDNCQGRFWVGMGFGQFDLEEDAAMFALRWR